MDLDHYGRADLSYQFVNSYVAGSRDDDMPGLLPFYKCYRACVRGKVACFQLDDPYITEEAKEQIRGTAAGYFDLATAYARPRPLLAITAGLTGTGKSELAAEIARRFGLAYISSDVTRKKLAGIPPTEHRYDEFSTGIYSAEFSRLTYDTLYSEATRFLEGGTPVILDAAFLKETERRQAGEVAQRAGADFLIIECTLDEAAIRERLASRLNEESASDGRPEVLEFQQGIFEPIVDVSPLKHVIINTSPSVETLAGELRPLILGLSGE
jgi:predicted kinase